MAAYYRLWSAEVHNLWRPRAHRSLCALLHTIAIARYNLVQVIPEQVITLVPTGYNPRPNRLKPHPNKLTPLSNTQVLKSPNHILLH